MEDSLSVLQNVLSEINEDSWIHVLSKGPSKLYRKHITTSRDMPIHYITSTINRNKEDLIKILTHTGDKKLTIMDDMIHFEWKELEKGDKWQICYQYNTNKPPFWGRHIIYKQSRIDIDNITYIVSHSIKYSHDLVLGCESKSALINLYYSVHAFTANSDNTTDLKFILRIRFSPFGSAGHYPGFLSQYSERLLNYVNSWNMYLS
jgi:hypothetical protein